MQKFLTFVVMEQETFRNSIGTVDDKGKRVWVYPKKPKGRYYRYRKYVSYVLLTIFFVSPFFKIDGKFQWHQVERIYSKFLESKWNNCTSIGLE